MVSVQALNIPELCEASGVSMRTLEYGFRETFGLTPLSFLRLLRFHAANGVGDPLPVRRGECRK